MAANKKLQLFPVLKLFLILLPLVFLPAAAFTLLEISRLSENETALQSILENQLNSILYSVNQYSQDVVSGWASEIDREMNSGWQNIPLRSRLDSLLNKNSIRKGIVIFDENLNMVLQISEPEIDQMSTNISKPSSIAEIQTDISKLKDYLSEGYRKIEPSEFKTNNYRAIQFLVKGKKYFTCLLVYDADKFVRELLSAQMNRLAEDRFILSVTSNDQIIYSTSLEANPNSASRNLWISPDLSISAGFKGSTLDEFLQSRYETNLIIIIVMFLFSFLLYLFIISLIRKEIKLAQLKSDFVSNVSHELRTPLSLISLYGETLEMNRVKSEEKRNEYYAIISSEARRLSTLVNKILSFSKIEAGSNLNKELIEVNSLINSALENFRYHLENRNFEYNIEKSETDLFILGDRTLLTEVIHNLLENAVKYSEKDRHISIKVSDGTGSAKISIADKGIGISENEKKKIFEKFYRVNSGLTNNKKGTGIGLSIVKNSVEMHGGSIIVEDNPGGGTIFTIIIPKTKPE